MRRQTTVLGFIRHVLCRWDVRGPLGSVDLLQREDWSWDGRLGEGRLGELLGWRRHQHPGRIADYTPSRGASDAAGIHAALVGSDLRQDQFS